MSQGMMMPQMQMQPPPAPAKPAANTKTAKWLLVQMISQIAQGFQKAIVEDETVQSNEQMRTKGEAVMDALHEMGNAILADTK